MYWTMNKWKRTQKCLETEYHTPKNGLSGYWEKTHPHTVDNYVGNCRRSTPFSISSFLNLWVYFDHGDHCLVCQHTFIYEKKVSKKSFLIIPIIYKWQQCRKARYFIPKIPYTWMKKTSDTLIPKTSGRAWWNVFQALQTLPQTPLRPFINTLQAFYKRLWKI